MGCQALRPQEHQCHQQSLWRRTERTEEGRRTTSVHHTSYDHSQGLEEEVQDTQGMCLWRGRKVYQRRASKSGASLKDVRRKKEGKWTSPMEFFHSSTTTEGLRCELLVPGPEPESEPGRWRTNHGGRLHFSGQQRWWTAWPGLHTWQVGLLTRWRWHFRGLGWSCSHGSHWCWREQQCCGLQWHLRPGLYIEETCQSVKGKLMKFDVEEMKKDKFHHSWMYLASVVRYLPSDRVATLVQE